MEIVFVIKSFTTGRYFSVNEQWDDWNMCREFETKKEALDSAISNDLGMCVIEEVYKT